MTGVSGWDELQGNEAAVAALRHMARAGRLPHALLFAGPRGVGKFLAARLFAAALLCGREEGPCGACPSCRAAAAQAHPDWSVVRPDGQAIKIEQVRALQSALATAPALAKRRVALLDDAERMTLEAANSLLKLLEEPAGETVFLLVSGSRQMLPETVLSRCTTVSFAPLQDALVERLLRAAGAEEAEAAALAALAGGSFGRAVFLRESGGLALRDEALGMLERVAREGSGGDFLRAAEALGAMERPKLQEFLVFLHLLLRELLLVKRGAGGGAADRLRALAPRWTARQLVRRMEQIVAAQKMLRANANGRLLIERLWIQFSEGEQGDGHCRP